MSKLITDEKPIVILPSLAKLLGINEAIILQQIHYWLERSNNIHDGYKWVYNSVAEWQKQFPWLAIATLKRKFKSLEDKGLLITGNYNKKNFDKTKWYRIDYNLLNEMGQRLYQNDTTIVSNCTNGKYQNDTTNTRDYTENNTDTYNSNEFDYNEFIEWFNELADKDFKNTETNRQYIKDLLNDGYTKDDIVNVIEYKVNEWKDSEKMNMYLRFSTLLSPNNFERYLQDAKEFLPSEPQEKRKRKVPLKEKERDPIDKQIRQVKLFLENFSDNEVIKAELKKLEQIRDELNKIDEQIHQGKLDNENVRAKLKRLKQIRDELNKINDLIFGYKLFLSEHPDNEVTKKGIEKLEQQRQDMIEKAMILSE